MAIKMVLLIIFVVVVASVRSEVKGTDLPDSESVPLLS